MMTTTEKCIMCEAVEVDVHTTDGYPFCSKACAIRCETLAGYWASGAEARNKLEELKKQIEWIKTNAAKKERAASGDEMAKSWWDGWEHADHHIDAYKVPTNNSEEV